MVIAKKIVGHDADKQEVFRRIYVFERRGIITYVAVVSANPDSQPFLPQIYLDSRTRFRHHLSVVVEEEHSNYKCWRESSCWNSSERSVRIIHSLVDSLENRL